MAGWTSAPFLPFLNVPTLILAGDRDKIVPLINSKMIHRLLPDSTLHVIAGGGHLFIVSRIAEIVPLIRQFLDAPATPRRAHRPPRPAQA
jgi:pimeloyl-ACP methyl ester carboxylesterase